MLLNIPQHTEQSPQQRITWLNMPTVPRLRNPALEPPEGLKRNYSPAERSMKEDSCQDGMVVEEAEIKRMLLVYYLVFNFLTFIASLSLSLCLSLSLSLSHTHTHTE